MEPLRKALQAERYRPRLDELQRDDPPLVPFHWEKTVLLLSQCNNWGLESLLWVDAVEKGF
jgi:hypothetical protein